ncbi:MAG: hypothetical protein HY512_00675 [Candidatus Aenigmarchaeota archaeon]|nr:hypothetical protein [Candidatus Aenigmarchaeota archaeon]
MSSEEKAKKVSVDQITQLNIQLDEFRQHNLRQLENVRKNIFGALIDNWHHQFSILSERVKEFKKYQSRLKKSRDKWIFHDDLPISVITLYDINEKKFINPIKTKDDCDELLELYATNKYFLPHNIILKEALYAHSNKNYIVSIPLLLTQIDGIYFTYAKRKKTVYQNKYIKGVQDSNSQANFKNLEKHLNLVSKEFLEFIDKKVGVRAKKHTLWTYRNDVLHGKRTNYAEEQWSTKLLFILRLLHVALK